MIMHEMVHLTTISKLGLTSERAKANRDGGEDYHKFVHKDGSEEHRNGYFLAGDLPDDYEWEGPGAELSEIDFTLLNPDSYAHTGQVSTTLTQLQAAIASCGSTLHKMDLALRLSQPSPRTSRGRCLSALKTQQQQQQRVHCCAPL